MGVSGCLLVFSGIFLSRNEAKGHPAILLPGLAGYWLGSTENRASSQRQEPGRMRLESIKAHASRLETTQPASMR